MLFHPHFVDSSEHRARPVVVQHPGAKLHVVLGGLAVRDSAHQRQQCAAGVQPERSNIVANSDGPVAHPVVQQLIQQLGAIAEMVIEAPAGDAVAYP